MSSDDHVALVRGAYDALAREGVEGILHLIAPDFEVETPAELAVEPQVYRGPEGVKRWFDTFYEVMDEVNLEADEFIRVDDERVIVLGRVVARGQDSGIEANQGTALVWTIRDGKAVRMDVFAGKEQALAAVGLEA